MEARKQMLTAELLRRPIAFHRIFSDLMGCAAGGLFLSQLYYWSDKGADPEGYIFKTFEDWNRETALSRREWETARRRLKAKELLEEERRGLNPRIFYKLNLDKLFEYMHTFLEPQSARVPHCTIVRQESYDQTSANVQSADASYIQRIQTENTHKESITDAQERGGAHGYLCDSKSFEPENPETATDRGQDTDLEPLRKATTYQNPEPETALQDCPEPDIEPLRKAQTFRNSEQNLSNPAETTQKPSINNSNLEETNIPPAAAKISGVEAAFTPTEVPKPIKAESSALTARFSHEADYHNNPVIQEAIDTYNQFRGCWGECENDLSPTARKFLLQIYSRQLGDLEEKRIKFLALVRDAVLWMNKNDYYSGRKAHKGNYHNGKNFRFLIGDRSSPDRMADFACEWRSEHESAKVGLAIKLSQQKPVKEYVNLDGKVIDMTDSWILWWAISKRAMAGEAISEHEKNWANIYFPKYDIYVGAEELDD
jgi:hypothetical protein